MKTVTCLIFVSIILLFRVNLTAAATYEKGSNEDLRKRFSNEYSSTSNTLKNLFLFKWKNPLMSMTNARFRQLCQDFAPQILTTGYYGSLEAIQEDDKNCLVPYEMKKLRLAGMCFGESLKSFPRFDCVFEFGSFSLICGSKNYGMSNKFDAYVSTHDVKGEMMLVGVIKAISY